MNNTYPSQFALDLSCLDKCNEGGTILLVVVCHMFLKLRSCKNEYFCWCGYKNIQLICPVSIKVLIKIRKEIT